MFTVSIAQPMLRPWPTNVSFSVEYSVLIVSVTLPVGNWLLNLVMSDIRSKVTMIQAQYFYYYSMVAYIYSQKYYLPKDKPFPEKVLLHYRTPLGFVFGF